ncbi:hypothetical protein D3C84_486540 [compost metagenome]
MADQVERIERLALFLFHFFGQGFPHHALGGHFVDDGLFLLSITPMAQKIVQRGELFLHAGAGVVAQRFGDQSAIRAVVLHTLGDDVNRDVVDDVLDAFFAFILASEFHAIIIVSFACDDAVLIGKRIVWRYGGVVTVGCVDHHRVAVEGRVGKQLGGLFEVHDGEPVLAVVFVNASAATDDLLELGHRFDVLVEHNQLAGLSIDAGGHQLAGGGNHRVALFRVDEVIQLGLAFLVIAGDAHDVLAVLSHALGVEVDQGLAHALGVVDVVAEDDGFLEWIGGFDELGDLLRDQLGARLDDQGAVHVLEVVDAVFDQLAILIEHAFGWPPALQVFIEVDTHYFVGGEKAVFDALLQGVAVNRLTEVSDAGYFFGFLWCGGKADMGGAGEVFEDFTPGGILGGAATVAFVDHDQVEEVAGELLVDVHLFISAGDGLIERQVDLVGGIDLAFGDFGHRLAEGLEVVVLGLVDQDVAVGQKQDAFLLFRFPQPPDDLEGCVGLAGARSHHQQDTVLTARHSLDGAVDGIHLVIARHAPGAVVVVRRFNLLLRLAEQSFPLAVTLPELCRAGELIETQLGFDLSARSCAVMEQKAITIAGEHEGHIQRIGITQRLLHAGAERVLVVLGFNHRQRQVLVVAEQVVGTLALATAVQLATHHDSPGGKAKLFEYLLLHVPARLLNSRGDEFAADVPLSERFLVHPIQSIWRSVAGLYQTRDCFTT